MTGHVTLESIAERFAWRVDDVFGLAMKLGCRVVRDARGDEFVTTKHAEVLEGAIEASKRQRPVRRRGARKRV